MTNTMKKADTTIIQQSQATDVTFTIKNERNFLNVTVSMKNPQPTSYLTVKDRAFPEITNKGAWLSPPVHTAEVLTAAIRQGQEKGTSAGTEVKPSLFANDATMYGKSQRPQQKAKQLQRTRRLQDQHANIRCVSVHQQWTIWKEIKKTVPFITAPERISGSLKGAGSPAGKECLYHGDKRRGRPKSEVRPAHPAYEAGRGHDRESKVNTSRPRIYSQDARKSTLMTLTGRENKIKFLQWQHNHWNS